MTVKSSPMRESPNEELVMHLAENTDVSPKQARDLIKRHGTDKNALLRIARAIKAES